MFPDDYNKKMDNITPDETVKQEIRKRLESGGRVKRPALRAVYHAGLAAALCVSVLCGTLFLRNNNAGIKAANEIVSAQSYADVYNTVESLIPKVSLKERLFGYAEKNSAVDIDEEYLTAVDDSNGATKGSVNNGTAGAEAAKDAGDAKGDYSKTTTQVDGVDEADIVKTDGEYIYLLYDNTVKIVKAEGKTVNKLPVITLDSNAYYTEMYLLKDRLVVLGVENGVYYYSNSFAVIYDVSNPEKAEKIETCKQSGYYNTSRMIGSKLYLITNYNINTASVKRDDPKTFVPSVECKDNDGAVTADSVRMYQDSQSPSYVVICAYDVKDGRLAGTQSVLGGTDTVYCSTTDIIGAASRWYDGESSNSYSVVSRFTINDGEIKFIASGKINGTLLNQFSIDGYKGYFRFVTTVNTFEAADETVKPAEPADSVSTKMIAPDASANSAALYILDGQMKTVGKIEDLAKGERVYSVRFMGDIGYFVTFRNTDPLFSADLSNPKEPKIIGELKIPGFSNYLYPYGDGRLLGIGKNADEQTGRTQDVKLSMFDISDPSNVSEYAKTDVTGAEHSDALYNHKACIVDVRKNLIGFPVYTRFGARYMVYSFEGDKFSLRADIKLLGYESTVRGLYIGDYFYVVTEKAVSVYDISDFRLLSSTYF